MLFNINDNVHVKLTNYGKTTLQTWYKNRGLPQPDLTPDAEGWTTWPLWELMSKFGSEIYMGGIACFEMTIDIPIIGSTLEQDNQVLRRMLAVRASPPGMLYTDDGELSCAATEPTIDFKRDRATDIDKKLKTRISGQIKSLTRNKPK